MPNKNKIKGSKFELDIVKYAQQFGFEAKRVPLSGALPDLPEDVVIDGGLYQCKKKKKLPLWLEYPKAVGVIMAQDYGQPMILLPLATYLGLLKELKEAQNGAVENTKLTDTMRREYTPIVTEPSKSPLD